MNTYLLHFFLIFHFSFSVGRSRARARPCPRGATSRRTTTATRPPQRRPRRWRRRRQPSRRPTRRPVWRHPPRPSCPPPFLNVSTLTLNNFFPRRGRIMNFSGFTEEGGTNWSRENQGAPIKHKFFIKWQSRVQISAFFGSSTLNNFFITTLQNLIRNGNKGQTIGLTSLKISKSFIEKQKFGDHFPGSGRSTLEVHCSKRLCSKIEGRKPNFNFGLSPKFYVWLEFLHFFRINLSLLPL